MDIDDVKAMMAAAAASDRPETIYHVAGWTLRLVRRPTGRRDAADTLDAPMGGILHLQPAPGTAAFVAEGQAVRIGDPLFVIEAMKVFNTVRSDRDFVVGAILAANGAEIEAGQPVMRCA